MRIIEKKCPNCGAKLKFNLEDSETKCEYCNSEFVIENNNESSKNVNVDKINLKFAKTFSIIHLIVFSIVSILIIVVFITVFTNMFKYNNNYYNSFFDKKENKQDIQIEEISDKMEEKLYKYSKNEMSKWSGFLDTYKLENDYEKGGIYYLKKDSYVQIIYILKSTYNNGENSKDLYTAFKYYGNNLDSLKYTPYIDSNIYKLNNLEFVYGYETIEELYDNVVRNQKSLGYSIVASDDLYND